jgi:hypothetical protein
MVAWSLSSVLLLTGSLFVSASGCSNSVEDVNIGGGGTGGSITTTTTTQSGPTTTTTTTGGSCDCVEPNPICVDGQICAATCPNNRAECAEGDGLGCCAIGDVCCPGTGCAPASVGCPTLCPDGTTTCPKDTMCQLDPATEVYGCVTECPNELECGDVCCARGSRCEGGKCPLPDLSIDVPFLTSTVEIRVRDFSQDACVIQEGCVTQAGRRRLLRFSLKTPNKGAGDLFMGEPWDSPLFEYSSCHDHFHFQGYANYRLLDANNQPVALGHKQAFCLLDFEALGPNSPQAQYDCNYQGISAGWSDIYESSLPCQWVDVTDVAGGTYTLEVKLNEGRTLIESDYTNNIATISVTIPPNSCPGGCNPVDAAACQPGDPLNKANNGICDCGGMYDWDIDDCKSCVACDLNTTCPGGCTLSTDACCAPGNPCNKANDGVCDCEGLQPWDTEDCKSCASNDPECANVNTCPGGCANAAQQPGCCGPTDTCGYANDGWCDCSGTAAWDSTDCSHCTTVDPDCP